MRNTDQPFLQVYKTTDYDKFKIVNGNRDINEVHVKRLIQSFQNNHLVSIITVNEKFQIIDGQHRFLASKEKQLPLYYVILKGYGLEEVQVLNTNSSNWKKVDHLKSYCDLGYASYIQMQKFMDDFPEFGIKVTEMLLSNKVEGVNSQKANGRMRSFEEGKLEIPNLRLSYANAKKIMMFKPLYEGFNRAAFVSAMIGIFKNPNYNHDEMIAKIKKNPTMMKDCSNSTQYKAMLEEIYNLRRRDKVNLKY